MKIRKKDVEWAVVDRLRLLLTDERPETEYEVTLTFALFTGILLWSRQSLGRHKSCGKWPSAARRLLSEPATKPPWNVRADSLKGACHVGEFLGSKKKRVTLEDATIWQLVVFLRNCIGHGDGRTVEPHHRKWAPCSPEHRLHRFIFISEKCTDASVRLSEQDMKRIGKELAQVICQAYCLDYSRKQDAKGGVVEKNRPVAKTAEI